MPPTPRPAALNAIIPGLLQKMQAGRSPEFSKHQDPTPRNPGTRILVVARTASERRKLAESVATELKRELVRVQLGALESKYIGETEKNISKVFDAAEAMGWILFFDEGDALFGRRTGVKEAQDRYARLKVTDLAQRVERSPAVTVVGTTRPEIIDPQVLRRLRFALTLTPPAPPQKPRVRTNHVARPSAADGSG